MTIQNSCYWSKPFFMEKLDPTEVQPSAVDYQQILVEFDGYKNLS